MSFCAAMQRPVTSSATLLRWAKPTQRCSHALRSFSSYGNAYQSSRRDMQTATAYRPHSLPSSFPPPRSNSGQDTSISAEFPLPSKTSQKPSQSESTGTSVREGEAQKSKPISSTASKTSPKPRRPLRARKAAMKLTPLATEQLRNLMAQPEPKFIRVGVKNRGCSGLAYHLEYVEKPGKFDEVVEQDGVKVLIDSKALFSIIGSEMDWQEDKLSRRFVFRNPNISEFPADPASALHFFFSSCTSVLTRGYRGIMWMRRIFHGLSTPFGTSFFRFFRRHPSVHWTAFLSTDSGILGFLPLFRWSKYA